MLPHPVDAAFLNVILRKGYVTEGTSVIRARCSVGIIHAKVSIIFCHAIVYRVKHYISANTCRHRTKLNQLAVLKTLINKPQSTHATHSLITSKDSKMLELLEVDLFFHKSYVGSGTNPINPVVLTNAGDTRKWEKPFYCIMLKLACYLGTSHV